jgi:lipoprotein-anchoring transpeptidase ErfK/SrfK
VRAEDQTPQAPRDIDPALTLQVLLDRAGFSPGEIDGRRGANTSKAIAAARVSRGLSGDANEAMLIQALSADEIEPVVSYTITAEDADGPFTPRIPDDMMEKAKLKALGYTSVVEALAERFHASPALLRQLNPGVTFAAGDAIRVPNVVVISDRPAPPVPGVSITVSKRLSTLTANDASGTVLFHAPVTSGSEHDPLPIGQWTVTAVSRNPAFNYNPDLFWDADPAHAKAKIPPGPNGPVGVVWIDLSREHYGIHGTSEPARIGYTTSHGCVRLTNWDALRVAQLVTKGTVVHFVE